MTMEESVISRIPVFAMSSPPTEGFDLSVTSAATNFISKFKNNNILPICVCHSHAQEVLNILLKNSKYKLSSVATDSPGISLFDKVIPLKNEGVIMLIEIPDESISINPAEGSNALAYIQLAFSLYIAKYTIFSEKPSYNVDLSVMQIKREFLVADEAGEVNNNSSSANISSNSTYKSEIFSKFFGSIDEFKDSIEFKAKCLRGNPLKGEVFLYMIYEFQQGLLTHQPLDIYNKFETHSIIYLNKQRDEFWHQFQKKARSQISENNYPYEELFISARIDEAEADILNEFEARIAEFTFTQHALTARKLLQEKIRTHREELLKHNAAISEEFCTNLIVHIYEHFTMSHSITSSAATTTSTADSNSTGTSSTTANADEMSLTSLLTHTTLLEKHVMFQDLLNMYLQHARGPYKYRLLAETQTRFTFGFFEEFFNAIQEHFASQIVQQKAILFDTEERLRECENQLASADQQKLKSDEEIGRLQKQLKESALESQKLHDLQLLEAYNTKQLEALTKKLDKKKAKITKVLDESNKLILDSRKLKEELADREFMLKTLKEKLNKYEDLTATAFRSSAAHSISRPQNDLASTLQEFKQYVRRAEDSIVKIATERESLVSSTTVDASGIQRRDKEIEALKEERNQLKKQIEATRIEERRIFANERTVLEQQIETMTKEKFQLMDEITKWKIMELEFNQAKMLIEEQAKCLEAERRKYEQTFDFLDIHRKNYEEQSELIFHIQQQLVESKTLSGDQDIIIDNLFHLLPQLILHMRNKPNKMLSCLKSLSEYTTQVAQILQDNGVKIN